MTDNSKKDLDTHPLLRPHNDEDGLGLSVFSRLRGYFLAGILVTAPIGITVYLTYIFIRFIDKKVTHIIPEVYNPNTYLPFSVPGLGLIVVIVFFILVGWFAKNFLGRLLIRISEYIVHRMPVIRNIYGAIKQIFETIMATQSQAFREVVMLEYPRKGVWSIGFVTGRSEGQVQRVTENETINVFVPTTPNPTSGYLLFVPKKELKYLNMTVEEGVKLVVSAGIISPPDRLAPEEMPKEAPKKAATKKAPAKKTTAKKAAPKKRSDKK